MRKVWTLGTIDGLPPLRELIENIDIDDLVDEFDEGWALYDALRAKLTTATGTGFNKYWKTDLCS